MDSRTIALTHPEVLEKINEPLRSLFSSTGEFRDIQVTDKALATINSFSHNSKKNDILLLLETLESANQIFNFSENDNKLDDLANHILAKLAITSQNDKKKTDIIRPRPDETLSLRADKLIKNIDEAIKYYAKHDSDFTFTRIDLVELKLQVENSKKTPNTTTLEILEKKFNQTAKEYISQEQKPFVEQKKPPVDQIRKPDQPASKQKNLAIDRMLNQFKNLQETSAPSSSAKTAPKQMTYEWRNIPTENLEKKNLMQVIEANRYAMPNISWINKAIEVAEAIKQLHDGNQTYGDIKPDNILLTASKIELAENFSPGTMGYMAPEIYNKDNMNPTKATDIYALGKTYAEAFALTKNIELSIDDPNALNLINDIHNEEQLINGQPRKILTEKPALAMQQLVQQMTAANPDVRTKNMADVIEQLKEVRKQLTLDERFVRVGYLHLDEYSIADDEKKHNMLSVLQDVDEIYLLATKNISEDVITATQKDLQTIGLSAHDKLINYDNPDHLQDVLLKFSQEQNNDSTAYCFPVYPSFHLLVDTRIIQINPLYANAADYEDEIQQKINQLNISNQDASKAREMFDAIHDNFAFTAFAPVAQKISDDAKQKLSDGSFSNTMTFAELAKLNNDFEKNLASIKSFEDDYLRLDQQFKQVKTTDNDEINRLKNTTATQLKLVIDKQNSVMLTKQLDSFLNDTNNQLSAVQENLEKINSAQNKQEAQLPLPKRDAQLKAYSRMELLEKIILLENYRQNTTSSIDKAEMTNYINEGYNKIQDKVFLQPDITGINTFLENLRQADAMKYQEILKQAQQQINQYTKGNKSQDASNDAYSLIADLLQDKKIPANWRNGLFTYRVTDAKDREPQALQRLQEYYDANTKNLKPEYQLFNTFLQANTLKKLVKTPSRQKSMLAIPRRDSVINLQKPAEKLEKPATAKVANEKYNRERYADAQQAYEANKQHLANLSPPAIQADISEHKRYVAAINNVIQSIDVLKKQNEGLLKAKNTGTNKLLTTPQKIIGKPNAKITQAKVESKTLDKERTDLVKMLDKHVGEYRYTTEFSQLQRDFAELRRQVNLLPIAKSAFNILAAQLEEKMSVTDTKLEDKLNSLTQHQEIFNRLLKYTTFLGAGDIQNQLNLLAKERFKNADQLLVQAKQLTPPQNISAFASRHQQLAEIAQSAQQLEKEYRQFIKAYNKQNAENVIQRIKLADLNGTQNAEAIITKDASLPLYQMINSFDELRLSEFIDAHRELGKQIQDVDKATSKLEATQKNADKKIQDAGNNLKQLINNNLLESVDVPTAKKLVHINQALDNVKSQSQLNELTRDVENTLIDYINNNSHDVTGILKQLDNAPSSGIDHYQKLQQIDKLIIDQLHSPERSPQLLAALAIQSSANRHELSDWHKVTIESLASSQQEQLRTFQKQLDYTNGLQLSSKSNKSNLKDDLGVELQNIKDQQFNTNRYDDLQQRQALLDEFATKVNIEKSRAELRYVINREVLYLKNLEDNKVPVAHIRKKYDAAINNLENLRNLSLPLQTKKISQLQKMIAEPTLANMKATLNDVAVTNDTASEASDQILRFYDRATGKIHEPYVATLRKNKDYKAITTMARQAGKQFKTDTGMNVARTLIDRPDLDRENKSANQLDNSFSIEQQIEAWQNDFNKIKFDLDAVEIPSINSEDTAQIKFATDYQELNLAADEIKLELKDASEQPDLLNDTFKKINTNIEKFGTNAKKLLAMHRLSFAPLEENMIVDNAKLADLLVRSINNLETRAKMSRHSNAPHAKEQLDALLQESNKLLERTQSTIKNMASASKPETNKIDEMKTAVSKLEKAIGKINQQKPQPVKSVMTYSQVKSRYISLSQDVNANMQLIDNELRKSFAPQSVHIAGATIPLHKAKDSEFKQTQYRIDEDTYAVKKSDNHLFQQQTCKVRTGLGINGGEYSASFAYTDDFRQVERKLRLVAAIRFVERIYAKLPASEKDNIFTMDEHMPEEMARDIKAYFKLAQDYQRYPEPDDSAVKYKTKLSETDNRDHEESVEKMLRDPEVIEKIMGKKDLVLSAKQAEELKQQLENPDEGSFKPHN